MVHDFLTLHDLRTLWVSATDKAFPFEPNGAKPGLPDLVVGLQFGTFPEYSEEVFSFLTTPHSMERPKVLMKLFQKQKECEEN